MRPRSATRKDSSETGRPETVERVGGLTIAQPAKGYRYGLDPFLLAGFTKPRLREKIVDLGTGCGIIALLLAREFSSVKVWGIELQPELAAFARENVMLNTLGDRCIIVEGDVRHSLELLPAAAFQRVVSNPPFRPEKSGRTCPEPQRAIARQEVNLTFDGLADAASGLLGHGGIFDFIHLSSRLPETFRTLTLRQLEPKRLRLIHSFRDSAPELALVSARKGGRPGLSVMPPLVIFGGRGSYTKEVRSLMRRPAGAARCGAGFSAGP